MDYEWLQKLKVGDVVIEVRGMSYSFYREIVKISKITTRYAVVDHGKYQNKYRLDDGSLVGRDRFGAGKILEGTPERINEVASEVARRWNLHRVQSESWEKLTNDQLQRLADLLDS